MPEYDPLILEQAMQKYWEEIDAYRVDDKSKKPKAYVLDMFPYPSGDGLHIGHVEGYTATDIVARYKRMTGHEVLHPMGWDSFGLPAENYAMKVGKHPRITTDTNTANFRRQLKMLGFSYDWAREIDTSSEEYYRWSQWFFLLMYRKGLAYRKEAAVNWCDICQTVLANEQVVDGKCERTKNLVTQKMMPQWFFKVTAYADRLLEGLDALNWPESLKHMQRNWIGRSEGAYLEFAVKGSKSKIKVFTTRPDTLYGVTYVVLAPEHPLVKEITAKAQAAEVKTYVEQTSHRSELERTGTDQQKTGVFTGAMAIHPITGEEIPVWTADYVLMNYGTGAVMAVPAHDERDFAFAKKYKLDIKCVISPVDDTSGQLMRLVGKTPDEDPQKMVEEIHSGKRVYEGAGVLMNSDKLNGVTSEKAIPAILKAAKGEKAVTYRIRDWIISRQRFWGAPIPIVYCEACGIVAVPEEELPVKLPKEADFTLKGDGKSPLARIDSFVNTRCPQCDNPAKRETDTMDGFVDNSWYYYRFADPHNHQTFAAVEALERWMPVDLYVGGAEHAVGHLIYSRFFTKVLADESYVNFQEPFKQLVNQGLILAADGQKMSKSLGNVVNPDDVVKTYGADTLRMYEMFLGPLHEAKPWDTKGILGVRRFLERVYRFFEGDAVHPDAVADQKLTALLHKTTKKVTEDIENLRFNTAVSAMMIFMNEATAKGVLPQVEAEAFVKILSPFAPHLAEYLWQEMGHKDSVTKQAWPQYDERLTKDETVTMAVQINGKVRDTIEVSAEAAEADVKTKALASANVQKYLEGKEPRKVIYVKGRIINLIV